MKISIKSALIVVTLLFSTALCFAAEAPAPVLNVNGKISTADVKVGTKAKIVDINTATSAELKAISGIGEAYSEKIIAGRPYANKAQLKSRNILPIKVYEQVKDRIIAKSIKK